MKIEFEAPVMTKSVFHTENIVTLSSRNEVKEKLKQAGVNASYIKEVDAGAMFGINK